MAGTSILSEKEHSRKPILIVFACCTLSVLILLPVLVNYPLHLAALTAGIPIAALVLSNRLRSTALVLLFTLVPFVSILKAVTGSRYAPLTFDLAIALGCFISLLMLAFKKRLRLGLVDLLLLMFLMLAFLAMFHPNVPSFLAGVEGFRKFAFCAIAFFVGRHLLTRKHLHLFQKLTLIVSAIIALYGIKQFFFMSDLDWRMIDLATSSSVTYTMGGQVRPFSTLPGPFHLGLYLVITSLLVLSQLYAFRQRPMQWFWHILLLAIQIATLFLTRTKGNWGALVVGIGLLVLLLSGFRLRTILRLGGLVVAGGLIIFVSLWFSSGNENQVLLDAIGAFTNPSEAPTFVFRMQLWQDEMLPAIQKQFLFGYGTSSAGEGLSFYYDNTPSQHFGSHSLYLKILLELGIVGTLLFLLIIFLCLRMGWHKYRILRQNRDPLMQHHLWAICVISAFLVSGFVIPVLDAYPANYIFWLLLGSITTPLSRLNS